MYLSIVLRLVLLILTFFVVWRPPDPPLDAGSGVELNFGIGLEFIGSNAYFSGIGSPS
jgi:hypothetical protein